MRARGLLIGQMSDGLMPSSLSTLKICGISEFFYPQGGEEFLLEQPSAGARMQKWPGSSRYRRAIEVAVPTAC
jgi:hypothetical protein